MLSGGDTLEEQEKQETKKYYKISQVFTYCSDYSLINLENFNRAKVNYWCIQKLTKKLGMPLTYLVFLVIFDY